jgi:transcriptional regulator with XRE-family HTH domain
VRKSFGKISYEGIKRNTNFTLYGLGSPTKGRPQSHYRVRARIAIGLVKTHGVALAEFARRLGVSTSAISKLIKRVSQ